MRRLVLFVEGDGDADAVPTLVKKLLKDMDDGHDILLDDNPLRVGAVDKLVKADYRDWKRYLGVGLKRREVGGILLILDGDNEKVGGKRFCAAAEAKALANAATQVGAGRTFSAAVVFARQEYETWLIAGVASLAGLRLPDGRLIKADAKAPEGDLEVSPRNAKGWLRDIIDGGYKPTRDQAALTKLVEIKAIRSRELRSFRRFESAVSSLLQAIRCDTPIVSPT